MSSINTIISQLGLPPIPKDDIPLLSNVIPPIISNIDPNATTTSPLKLGFMDINTSPSSLGGFPATDGDINVLINKPYTLIVAKIQGTLPSNSILAVNGSDGTNYNIKSITNPIKPEENKYNFTLLGEIIVSSNVEQIVTYTITNNGQIGSANFVYRIKYVTSLPPELLSVNPKCPVGDWSKIDITFTLDECLNPNNKIPSPSIVEYNQMTNQKLNIFLGFTNTLENWAKFLLFYSTTTHGYSYNRICNISLTPNFTPSTILPTSILNLSFIITDVNLGTFPALSQHENALSNNKLSHRCIGDWLKANYKVVKDLVYIDKTNPNNPQPLIMSGPASCKIENFTIDKTDIKIRSSSPPVPFSPSNSDSSSDSSSNSMIFIIVGVVILVLFFIFKSKKY